jgi:hypothetical protein
VTGAAAEYGANLAGARAINDNSTISGDVHLAEISHQATSPKHVTNMPQMQNALAPLFN